MQRPQPQSAPQKNRTTEHLLAALVTQRLLPHDVPASQWQAIADTALAHGLAPMLYWAIKSAGMDAASIESGSAIAASARQTALSDILFEDAMQNISRAFSSADIPAVWLKGAALARTVYPQPCLRPMGDLDVLVPYNMRESALDTVQALGYKFDTRSRLRPANSDISEKRRDKDEAYVRNLSEHHFVLKGGFSAKVSLELHFGLHSHNDRGLLPEKHMQRFFHNTQAFTPGSQTHNEGLLPELHLPYLAVHNVVQHREGGGSLMRDLDVHLLITKNDLDWTALIDHAAALGWTRAVYRALERAVDYFATPVPESVLEDLSRIRPDHEDPFMIEKRHIPAYRWEVTRNTLSRLPIRAKMRFAADKLFPYAAFMRARYAVPQDRAIWPYYPYRWFDQGRVICHSIGRRIRAPKVKNP